MECKKCSRQLIQEDAVVCYGECKGHFHFDCAQVREVQYRKRTLAEKQSWTCSDCKSDRSKKDASTPGTPSLTDLYTLVMNVSLTLTTVQKDLKDISKSQQHLSDCYDEMDKKMKSLEHINKDVNVLKEALVEKDKQITDLTARVVHVEQYAKRRQLELTNVTTTPGEDLYRIVMKIGELIGVNTTELDIDHVYRLFSSTNKNPPILVEFRTINKRNEWINKRNSTVVTNDKVCGSGYGKNRIFINESLSSHFKSLLWTAKNEAKRLGYKFCWFRNDRILVKKAENDKVFVISCLSDVHKFIK